MEEDVKTIGDYLDSLKRRKWSLVLPIIILFVIAFAVALFYPRTYRSTSTILIEDQDIPRDFVVSTVTGYAEQRLQSITERIMSSTRLIQIMNQFNLYSDLRKKMTTDEIIELMRKDIRLQTIGSDAVDRRTGRGATIAFSLSYDGRDPETVQRVANQLATLYLEENLKARTEQSAGATRFLQDEANTMQQKLGELDAKIAVFKGRNIDALPELTQVNFQSMDRAERDLDQLKDQLKTLREKEEYLQTQLATIPTESKSQDKDMIRDLRAKLVQLQSRYSDQYPDVAKTKQDIAELEKRVAEAPPEDSTHPKNTISVAGQPDNPLYVTLASQLAGVHSDIDSVKRQVIDAQNKRDEYQRRAVAGPRVEETYKTLMTERNDVESKYNDLTKRTMEANVSQGLEKQQMGERFTLIDPARFPEKPVSPNVPAILLIGVFLGIAGGVGSISLKEYGDQSVRTPLALSTATGLQVIGSVPLIVTEEDRQKARARRKKVIAVAAVICVGGIVFFHFFIMDLTVLWAILSRRLML